jgi:type II secretory pathway component GspD/PulD (secretin)
MRIRLLTGVSILARAISAAAQTPQLDTSAARSLSIRFVDATIERAIATVSRIGGITVQVDATVTDEIQNRLRPMTLREASVEQALDAITRVSGLSYSVVDGKTVRIFKRP